MKLKQIGFAVMVSVAAVSSVMAQTQTNNTQSRGAQTAERVLTESELNNIAAKLANASSTSEIQEIIKQEADRLGVAPGLLKNQLTSWSAANPQAPNASAVSRAISQANNAESNQQSSGTTSGPAAPAQAPATSTAPVTSSGGGSASPSR